MENRKANLTVLVRSLLFFALFIISGCLPVIPDQSFKSSSDMAIVFGRVERLKNGESIPHSTSKRSWSRLCVEPIDDNYILPKFSNYKSHHCKYENTIRIPEADGYFTAAMPPGKYFIKAINIPAGNWTFIPDQTQHLATFDIISQKATYIGTIKVINTFYEENKEYSVYKKRSTVTEEIYGGPAFGVVGIISSVFSLLGTTIGKDEYMKLSSEEQGRYDEIKINAKIVHDFLGSYQIINEFEEAKKIFNSLYPNHSELVESLSEIKQESMKK
jgi:hypothetical protein